MNLSKTSQYAIRILSLMTMTEQGIVSAAFLVKELRISDKYTRNLMTKLAKAGLISAKQGRYGGYKFKKPPKEISLNDIIDAVENINKYYTCILGFSECLNEKPCALHDEWSKIKIRIKEFLENTYLDSIRGAVSEKTIINSIY